jgi:hypothetical protein
MADDPTRPEDLKKQAGAQSQVTDATEDQARAIRELDAAIRPLSQSYAQWGRFAKENATQQEKLTAALGKQIGLQTQLGGLLSGFIGKLKSAISFQGQYEKALHEMRQGQTAFAASMHATTDSIGSASKQSQKYVSAVRDSYIAAYDISNKYHIEQEKIFEVSNRLQSAFGDQMGAMKNQSKALTDLTEATVDFSRFMGVDLAQATEYVTRRSVDSQKTFKELRRETVQVSMAMDDYSRRLKKLGKRTQLTAQVTRKQMIQTLQELGQEFKTGHFDVGRWSGVFAKMIPMLRKGGVSARTALESMKQFVQGIAGADFSKFEHAQAALATLKEDVTKMERGPLKTGLLNIFKAQERGDIKRVQALEAVMKQMAGTPEWAGKVVSVIGQYSPAMMNVVMSKSVTDPLSRILFTQSIKSGETIKTLKESGKGSKEREEAFKKNQQKLLKQAHTAESLRHSAASRWFKFQNDVKKWMETYWRYFALAIAGLGIAKMLGGLGSMLAGRAGILGGIGRLLGGGAARAGATTAAGQAARMYGAAAPAAARAGLATRMGLLGRGAAVAARGGAGFMGVGVGGAALGVAGAAVGGVMFGKYLDKELGPALKKTMSKDFQRFLGKADTVADVLSVKVIPSLLGGTEAFEQMAKETTRIRGAVTPQMRKRFKGLEKEISDARKAWHMLTKEQKKTIKAKERYRDALKHRLKLEKKSAKVSAAVSTRLQKVTAAKRIQAEVAPLEAKLAKGQKITPKDITNIAEELGKYKLYERKGEVETLEAMLRGKGAGTSLEAEAGYMQAQTLRDIVKHTGMTMDKFINLTKASIAKTRIQQTLKGRGTIEKKVLTGATPEMTAMLVELIRKRQKVGAGGRMALPEAMKVAIAKGEKAGEMQITFDPGTGEKQTTTLSQTANGDMQLTLPGREQKVVIAGKKMANMLRKATKL